MGKEYDNNHDDDLGHRQFEEDMRLDKEERMGMRAVPRGRPVWNRDDQGGMEQGQQGWNRNSRDGTGRTFVKSQKSFSCNIVIIIQNSKLRSYGLCSFIVNCYGLCSFIVNCYGLCSFIVNCYGLCSFIVNCYGLCSFSFICP